MSASQAKQCLETIQELKPQLIELINSNERDVQAITKQSDKIGEAVASLCSSVTDETNSPELLKAVESLEKCGLEAASQFQVHSKSLVNLLAAETEETKSAEEAALAAEQACTELENAVQLVRKLLAATARKSGTVDGSDGQPENSPAAPRRRKKASRTSSSASLSTTHHRRRSSGSHVQRANKSGSSPPSAGHLAVDEATVAGPVPTSPIVAAAKARRDRSASQLMATTAEENAQATPGTFSEDEEEEEGEASHHQSSSAAAAAIQRFKPPLIGYTLSSYKPPNEDAGLDELEFSKGTALEVLVRHTKTHWCKCRMRSESGMFTTGYVSVYFLDPFRFWDDHQIRLPSLADIPEDLWPRKPAPDKLVAGPGAATAADEKQSNGTKKKCSVM